MRLINTNKPILLEECTLYKNPYYESNDLKFLQFNLEVNEGLEIPCEELRARILELTLKINAEAKTKRIKI